MAEKLIPGLPESVRISLLQQTREFDDKSSPPYTSSADVAGNATEIPTVLQTVLRSDEWRTEVMKSIKSMLL